MKAFRDLLNLFPRLAEMSDQEAREILRLGKGQEAYTDPDGRFRKIQTLLQEIIDFPQTRDIEDVGRANQAYNDATMSDEQYEAFMKRYKELEE